MLCGMRIERLPPLCELSLPQSFTALQAEVVGGESGGGGAATSWYSSSVPSPQLLWESLLAHKLLFVSAAPQYSHLVGEDSSGVLGCTLLLPFPFIISLCSVVEQGGPVVWGQHTE